MPITIQNRTTMKKKLISTLIGTVFMIFISTAIFAQNPGAPPPPPANPSGGNNLPVGGGAPIGSGLAILLALGAAYGWKKAVAMRKADEE
jgi:hypothetical protein